MANIRVCDRSKKPIPQEVVPGRLVLMLIPPTKDGKPVEDKKGNALPSLFIGCGSDDAAVTLGGQTVDLDAESYAVLYNNALQRLGLDAVAKLPPLPTREKKKTKE